MDFLDDKMIRRIKEIVLHPLFSGSAVMIFGSNLANFIAYIYHLVIGRMLGPELYGELAAVVSLIGLFAVSFSFFGLVIVKFVSSADRKERKMLFSWFTTRSSQIAIFVGIFVTAISPFIAGFLKIGLSVAVLLGPIITVFLLSFVYSSFLQGLLRFGRVVVANNISMAGRLALGILFVALGFSVFGAIFGLFISAALGLWLNRYFLKDYKVSKDSGSRAFGKKILAYAGPIFLVSLSTNSLYSTDVILVKHFFEAQSAGIYAALSTLGKIIFFGTAPVGAVMFPLVSQRQSQGKDYKKIFLLSLLFTLGISLLVLLIYWLAPEISLKILYGDKFLGASPYLVWIGLFMAIFSSGSLITGFYLSKGDTRIWTLVVLAALGQALGIWFFHSSIFQVITVNIISASFLLVSLLIYFGYETSKTKTKA